MAEGWTKIKGGAKFASVSERTFRDWLHQGLKYSQLPSGMIRVRYSAIDEFIERFAVNGNRTDEIVNEVLKGV